MMFCVSWILLNHRELLRNYEIDRSLLPPFCRYDTWNGGLLRGTVRLSDGERVAIYGSRGIFLTDTTGSTFTDYNRGLPLPAHYRNIRAMAVTADSTLYALSTTGLYRQVQPDTAWHSVDVPTDGDETLSDMIACGDSLIVLTRSRVYVSIKHLPLTIAGPVNASRPVLVPVGALLIFGDDRGTDIIPMPDHLHTLPMPLWNVALEIHSGRIYFGNPATYFFVFLIGLPVFWCLLSGYRISRR